MSSRPDAGTLVPLADINKRFLNLKIRSVGFLSCYKTQSAFGTISHGGAHLPVDLSLVFETLSMGSLTASPKVMVIGTLQERNDKQSLSLQAIHVTFVENLDFTLWERAAREHSRALHHRESQRKATRLSSTLPVVP